MSNTSAAPEARGGHVLISGAGNGIGRACAQAVATAGYQPILLDIDVASGQSAADEIEGATFIACDVADPSSIQSAVESAVQLSGGRLRGLVNNAGRTARSAFADTEPGVWRSVMSVNLDSVYHLTRACLPALRGGAVVNVASVAGLVGEEGLVAYSASKGAIITITRSLALELHDVRVNAVCPGQIATRLMKRVTENPVLLRDVTARIPLARLGRPEEVADVVTWLIGPESSFVNGAIIPVDGGETAGIKDIRATQA